MAERERHKKYRRQDEEREVVRQRIRDKVLTNIDFQKNWTDIFIALQQMFCNSPLTIVRVGPDKMFVLLYYVPLIVNVTILTGLPSTINGFRKLSSDGVASCKYIK